MDDDDDDVEEDGCSDNHTLVRIVEGVPENFPCDPPGPVSKEP